MSVNPPEIIQGGTNPPEVVSTEDFTEYLFTQKNKGFEADFTDDSAIVGSKPIKDADVTVSTKKGETVSLGIEGTRIVKSDFAVEGRGAMDLTVKTGLFKKNTVTGGKKADSVSFGNQVKLQKTTVDLGKGDDSITFGSQTTYKGKSTVDLGKGGADVIEFKAEPTGGKVVVENFDKNDTLTVGDKTYTYDQLTGEDAPSFEGIQIKFAD